MPPMRITLRLRLAAGFGTATLVTFVTGLAVQGLVRDWPDWRSLSPQLALLAHVPFNQVLAFLVWIALCAALFVVGLGKRQRRGFRLAILGGALLPIGFWVVAAIETRLWPELRETTSPFDRPWPSLPLLVYGLAAAWFLGRLGRTNHREVTTP
jgi:hypothetical protein